MSCTKLIWPAADNDLNSSKRYSMSASLSLSGYNFQFNLSLFSLFFP